MRTLSVFLAGMKTLLRGELARYHTGGESEVDRFEGELSREIGVPHALAVNSGTSALICALVGAGVGPGDEVLVPAYTWVSTAAAPLAVGAVPVLVEVDRSLTMDPADIRRKITPHTRAIVPVHMLNLVCDMGAIMDIAREHGLIVIEDACQAIGVTYRGKKVGSFGNAAAFSFNQHKNIKSGEGGAVVTSDAKLFARAGMYHDVGSYTRPKRFASSEPLFVGVNYRMPELSAAILRPQLKNLEGQIVRRQARRRAALEELERSRFRFGVSPHHSPDEAAALALYFDDPEEASAFARARGAMRLIDTGRHVYTNWQSVIAKRAQNPKLDPYAWAPRAHEIDEHTCPETLKILARTCTVSVAPDLPMPAYRWAIRRMATGALCAAFGWFKALLPTLEHALAACAAL